jgi:AcrR family transcriptional regulator
MTTDQAPKPRWERRKEARPAELLAAALELFVERGFAGTRLDDVAARAGVSKGTLYLYFQNKEDLFKAVVRENIVRNLAEMRETMASFKGSYGELIALVIRQWWERVGNSNASGITKLMIAESGNFPEITRFYYDEVIEPSNRLFRSLLERGAEAGEFRPVDAENFVQVMMGPMVMLMLWKHSIGPCSHKPIDTEKYLAMYTEIALTALRPETSQPASRST